MTWGSPCTTLSCMAKSTVYSWRISDETKAELEEEARRLGITTSELLQRATRAWIDARRTGTLDDAESQRRLHERIARLAGTVPVAHPASRAREIVRARLRARRAR